VFNGDLFFDVLIALFALLNPLYAIPVFLGMSVSFTSGERQRTAAMAAVTVLVALCVAALIGDQILRLFGIHIPSFQIAGGIIVLTIALSMLKGEAEEAKDAERETASPGKDVAVYPLGIPLLAGPGVFVTTIVMSSRIGSMADALSVGAGILAVVLILWLSMAFASTVSKFLSPTVINIGTRILGILLAAIAVEMVITGIDSHFGLPYGPNLSS
jgi:multiple antibiotic resistance protein